jgi:hypothetical protein
MRGGDRPRARLRTWQHPLALNQQALSNKSIRGRKQSSRAAAVTRPDLKLSVQQKPTAASTTRNGHLKGDLGCVIDRIDSAQNVASRAPLCCGKNANYFLRLIERGRAAVTTVLRSLRPALACIQGCANFLFCLKVKSTLLVDIKS